jgi:hypothetical protein
MAAFLDVTAPAPRVNFQLMQQFVGKRVTLVGKAEGVQNGKLRVKAADDGMVEVQLRSAVPNDLYVEVEGVVMSPNTIAEESIVGYGNTFGERVVRGTPNNPVCDGGECCGDCL